MDEDLTGMHFGAFYNDILAGVVSLFVHQDKYQFRKFAVGPNYQGKGIGSALLQHIISFTITEGGKCIWCNARTTAIGFYSKAGFITTGQTFSKRGFDYEVMQKLL